jgi:ATP synthase protein I
MSEPDYSWVRALGQVSSMGLLILVSTVIGLGMGAWLDGKLGTGPWLAFALTFVGLAAGIYESVRILVKVTRDTNR